MQHCDERETNTDTTLLQRDRKIKRIDLDGTYALKR